MCSDAPDMPDSNPGMLASAQASEKLGMEQIALSREQAKVQTERQARMDSLTSSAITNQMQIANENQANATKSLQFYESTFKPIESRLAADAMKFNTEEEQARLSAEAGGAVATAYDATRDGLRSDMLARGANVGDGKYLDTMSKTGISQAADTASAVTKARVQGRELGAAKLQDAASLGRGLSSNAATSYGIATSANNSAVNNQATANANYNSGLASTNQSASLGINMLGQATQAYQTDYQNKMGAYQSAVQQANANNSGAASAIGTIAGLALMSCDIRLKRDITPITTVDHGLGLYAYRYLDSEQWQTGFMAQEVQEVFPEAVVEGEDGFLKIDLVVLSSCMQSSANA